MDPITREISTTDSVRHRRGIHRPYPGENTAVGRKTGVQIEQIEPDEDGYEPFDQLLLGANGWTPDLPKKRKKALAQEEEDLDEDYGKRRMEIASPIYRIATAGNPIPGVLNRVGASARLVARSSDVEYDRVPSPRGPGANSRGYASPGLSRLCSSSATGPASGDDVGGGGFDNGFNNFQHPDDASPHKKTPSPVTNFRKMDQDDDEEEESDQDEEPESPKVLLPRKVNAKPASIESKTGKARRAVEEEQDQPEDDIAQGLDHLDVQPASDEDKPMEAEPPKKKAKRTRVAPVLKGDQVVVVKRGSKKENRPVPEGVRRSTRNRIPRLEWWRCEKVVYGRPPDGSLTLVPHIEKFIKIPQEEAEPLGAKYRKPKRGRSQSKTARKEDRNVVVYNPELGWDDGTPETCAVFDYEAKTVAERRVAWVSSKIDVQPAKGGEWSLQKIFGDGDFVAGGQLHIPPKGRKPTSFTKDNSYIFYIIEGAVNLKIGATSLVLATGAMFTIPRGNTYCIENIANKTTKIVYTQARKVIVDQDGRSVSVNGSGRTPGPGRHSSSILSGSTALGGQQN